MLESMSNLLYSSIYNVLCLYSIHVIPTTLYAATIYYSTKIFSKNTMQLLYHKSGNFHVSIFWPIKF